jgi:hypothetical protein
VLASEIDRAGAVIREHWCRHVDAEPQAQSVDPVWSHGGLMRYLTGHLHKDSQKTSAGVEGAAVQLLPKLLRGTHPNGDARGAAREAIAWRRLLWRAAQRGLDGDDAQAWAEAERDPGLPGSIGCRSRSQDGRFRLLEGRRKPRTNDDEGGSIHSELEAYLRVRRQQPILNALRYAAGFNLTLDKLRWCMACGIVAPAIDAHQRRRLDELGFTDLCPDCRLGLEEDLAAMTAVKDVA